MKNVWVFLLLAGAIYLSSKKNTTQELPPPGPGTVPGGENESEGVGRAGQPSSAMLIRRLHKTGY